MRLKDIEILKWALWHLIAGASALEVEKAEKPAMIIDELREIKKDKNRVYTKNAMKKLSSGKP